MAERVEGGDSIEPKSSQEQLPEPKPTAMAQPASVAAGSSTAQLDGRQPKRARDTAEVAGCNTVGGARKKRRGNKKSG